MRFGLTPFGSAVFGLVLVTGSADSTATASGHNEVTKIVSSTATSVASGSADVRRQAGILPTTLTALATAAGASVVEYHPLPVEISALAVASAQAQVDFSTYTFAQAQASTVGNARRLLKLYPLPANAVAEGFGEGQQWQMAEPSEAVARAIGYGTTYHLGYGNAVGSAALSDAPHWQKGAQGTAMVEALAEQVLNTLHQRGAAGEAIGVLTVQGDPAVTKGTVRYFEGVGVAEASCTIEVANPWVYQPQIGYGSCDASGYAWYIIGGKGQATATATGTEAALAIDTGATAISGDSNAFASGWASTALKGAGVATSSAVASGDGLHTLTRVTPLAGVSSAQASAALGLKSLYGWSIGVAQASGQTLMVDTGVFPQAAQAQATAVQLQSEVATRGATAPAMATAAGKSVTNKIATGTALSSATAVGGNQVNDLVRAPDSRTYQEPSFARICVVEAEPRLILV